MRKYQILGFSLVDPLVFRQSANFSESIIRIDV